MKILSYKTTYKTNPKLIHTFTASIVNETPEEFIARQNEMDKFSYAEALEIRDMTPAEIAQYNAENAAADYYARYGTVGEF